MNQSYNVDGFRDSFEHEFTWLNGFLRNVARRGDKPALNDPASGRRWTYSELNRDANRLAHALRSKGVKQGDIVMYMLLNSPEFALCYIACHKIGAIGCPVNFRLSAGEIAYQIDDSRPAAFIYDAEFKNVVTRALALASFEPAFLLETSLEKRKANGCDDFEFSMKGMSEQNPETKRRPHIYDETTRLYTSGTTHRAKAVPINSLNEVLTAHDVIMQFPLEPDARTMNMTPWFHRGGLHSGGPTPTWYVGGEVVILRDFNPRRCLQLAEEHKVTFLIGVPSIIAMLARGQKGRPADLSALKGIVSMGSPLEKSLLQECMTQLTPNLLNGYGTTETFWNTLLRPGDLPDHSGSAGRACIDDEVRIIRVHENGERGNPDDLVARDGKEVGEVIVRTPAKSAGCYVNNEKMTEKKFHNGFHYTGDLATWNKEGYVTIVGRKDDMILNAGENVYPGQIEEVLNMHPDVAESAVVGVPDRRHGESVAAFVVPACPGLTIESLKEFCLNHPLLPPFKRPRFYFLVEELPHTATGKLQRYKVRERAIQEFCQAERDAK